MRGRGASGMLAAIACVAALAAPAAASELVEIDVPSNAGNVEPEDVTFNGAGHPRSLKANVLLPDGFDPAKEYPVLYLLHGAGENFRTWDVKDKVREVAAGFPGIIVMPDGATGFYTDWWNGGRRGKPGWERYYLSELIPAIERRYKIRPGRRWHAIAGFSMGGYGSAYLASQRPDYFGAAAPFSGFLSSQRPTVATFFETIAKQPYDSVFGPVGGFYAEGHNPVKLAENLRDTRLFVITGNGLIDPAVGLGTGIAAATGGGVVEAELKQHADEFTAATRTAGAQTTYTVLNGTHDHPYWMDHLRRAIAWGLFEEVADPPARWTYRTVAERGRAWGFRYVFRDPPPAVATLRAAGNSLSAEGAGAIEVCTSDDRGFAAELPFEGRTPERAVDLSLSRRAPRTVARKRSLRVNARSSELQTVTYTARLARRGDDRVLGKRVLRMQPGVRRSFSIPLTPTAARRFGRLRKPRVTVAATYGRCEPERRSEVSRTLRR